MADWEQATEQLRRATVTILAGRWGRGSGVVRSPGEIVTNAHVVGGESHVQIELWDGQRLPAEVRARHRSRDLAALAIDPGDQESELPSARFGDSDAVRPGEWVLAIGSPFGVAGAWARGIVHGRGPLNGEGQEWIQADLRLAPGNSGGPLASISGEVIGINTMVAGGLALAIPGNEVLRFLDDEEESRAPARLGVVLEPVRVGGPRPGSPPPVGLRILHIDAGSPAALASLAPGDILIAVNGSGFRSPLDLRRAIAECEGVLQLSFVRGSSRTERKAHVLLSGKAA